MIRPSRFAAAVALVAVAGLTVWWLISVQLAAGPETARVTTGTVTWRWAGQRRPDIAGTGLSALTQTDGVFTHRFDEPAAIPTPAQCTPACAAW